MKSKNAAGINTPNLPYGTGWPPHIQQPRERSTARSCGGGLFFRYIEDKFSRILNRRSRRYYHWVLLYSPLFVVPGYLTLKALRHGSLDHTVLPAITPMPAFTSQAFTRWRLIPDWGCGHLIAAILTYLPRKDERLSWPGWLTYSGRFTHTSDRHPSAEGRAQVMGSSQVKDQRSTTVRRNQRNIILTSTCLVSNLRNAELRLCLVDNSATTQRSTY